MKAHVFCGISLDGFIARADGGLDFLDPYGDEESVEAYNEFVSGIDVFVFGRGTFEKVLEFKTWPFDKPVFVLSRSLKELPEGHAGKAELLAMDPAAVIEFLTERGFTSAYIDGGRVVQSFLSAGLIDTITLSRAPVLIGSGIPLFGNIPADIELEHLRTKVCPNGLVRSYYMVKAKAQTENK